MEIQQHDGVVVEVAGSRQGFVKRKRGGRGVTGGREAPGLQVRLPSLPSTIYRGQGGAGPSRSHLDGGAAAKGGALPPKASGAPPHPRVSTLGAGGGPRGVHQPTMGWLPSHFSPWGPPGWVAPPGGPPGPFRWSRYNTDYPETFPMAET